MTWPRERRRSDEQAGIDAETRWQSRVARVTRTKQEDGKSGNFKTLGRVYEVASRKGPNNHERTLPRSLAFERDSSILPKLPPSLLQSSSITRRGFRYSFKVSEAVNDLHTPTSPKTSARLSLFTLLSLLLYLSSVLLLPILPILLLSSLLHINSEILFPAF